ncbi:pilus assembly protein FlpE [Cellulomonas sp. DKR-3]|uniref:Pilus assembly protein FlpE n=1 Tax=Cellulomonas fulva TaxID=2835530 RepID=A0ABS5TYE6_9CELL|nr:pilus assembly protein FlpE [Cellulomonas fulva]
MRWPQVEVGGVRAVPGEVAAKGGVTRERAFVVGVVGGRGGAGTSTFAAALAARFARATATALVDLDRAGAGIDVLLALEDADGVRWPDLSAARGEVDGAQVLALLPRWGPCAVLSADRQRPTPPEPAVVADVLHALTGVCGVLVLDLDRSGVVAGESVAAACDALVVVAPRDLRTVAGVLALRPQLVGHGALTGLVAGGPAPGGLGADELALAVDLRLLGRLPVDRRTAAATERGGLPLTGGVARTAARVARELLAAA